jgi:predicted solute-binding protein
VGLNVVRRDVGEAVMERICATIRRSLRHSLASPDEVLARVRRFGRGVEGGCTDQFVAMFANRDSVRMANDVRVALSVLLCQAVDLGIGERVPNLDIVEGRRPAPARRPAQLA